MNKKKQRKLNEAFLDSYIEMDKLCCHKFGISSGGVTDYINRLINARFAPGRDDTLSRLIKYRNVRNKIAHESGALENLDEIAKSDLKWLAGFKKALDKKRDPFSAYLRKARKYARRRKIRKIFIGVFITLVVVAIAAFVLWFMK